MPSLSSISTSISNWLSRSNVLSDFGEGDLLYGLVNSRRAYVDELRYNRPDCQGPHIVDYMTPLIVGGPMFGGYPTYKGHRGGESRVGLLGDFLESHPKYNPFNSADPTAEAYFTRKRRVCKGGILFVLNQGKRVHFILDNLDMKRVVHKDGKDDLAENFGGAKHRGYTGAELRSVYRMRNNKKAMGQITFWENDKRVSAPWITNPMLWAEYTPGSER